MPLITTRSAASARGLGLFQQAGARTTPISGYELWLDASDAASFTYSSGSVVSRWTDKSANAYFFEPSSTTYAPTRTGTQNSKSTLVFDGTNDFLISTAAASTWKFLHDGTQSTVIIVYKNLRYTVGTSSSAVILDTTGYHFASISAGYQGFTAEVSDWSYTGYDYSSIETKINSGVIQSGQSYPANVSSSGYMNGANHNTWNVAEMLIDPNNATTSLKTNIYTSKATYPDSPATSITSYGWTSANTAASPVPLRIGWTSASSTYSSFQGEIAEIVIYKRKLSQSEVFEMRAYLKSKWNI